MKITFLGHAGALVDTAHGSILCDPWFSPAFFASWFPFPDNRDLLSGRVIDAISSPDYLYVSHSHDDHFDARFLHDHVSKDAVVILPDFPTSDHRRALEAIGFRNFLETHNGEPIEIDGLRLLTHALIAPTDGAIGDSSLAIDDGTATLFNQNDAKPTDLDAILEFGPYDGHLVQFSGAIWYPMVYRIPAQERKALGRRKRKNQFARATRFVREIDATNFFPFAGPPCFLDEELFHLNDFGTDDSNIFPDQASVLAEADDAGITNGRLTVPGTVVTLERGSCTVTHPAADEAAFRPFTDKEQYLREYQAGVVSIIAAEKAGWPRHEVDVVAELTEWWMPLLTTADNTCAGVNARVLVEVFDSDDAAGDHTADQIDDVAVVVDFLDRRVAAWKGEDCLYRLRIPRPLIERCIQRRDPNWVNALFLSCRFEAERDGPYNEFVYNFFRSLSTERMAYTERYYSELAAPRDVFELHGYVIQRHCPHLRADLTRWGSVEGSVLTCALHGWQFDLETGECLTSDDREIYARPVDGITPPPRADQ